MLFLTNYYPLWASETDPGYPHRKASITAVNGT